MKYPWSTPALTDPDIADCALRTPQGVLSLVEGRIADCGFKWRNRSRTDRQSTIQSAIRNPQSAMSVARRSAGSDELEGRVARKRNGRNNQVMRAGGRRRHERRRGRRLHRLQPVADGAVLRLDRGGAARRADAMGALVVQHQHRLAVVVAALVE